MAEDEASAKWYWCLRHNRAESADRCGSELLMGPYESRAAAEAFADTANAREDAWEAEDERWSGA